MSTNTDAVHFVLVVPVGDLRQDAGDEREQPDPDAECDGDLVRFEALRRGRVESSALESAWALMAAITLLPECCRLHFQDRRHFQRSRQADRSRKIPVMRNSMAVRIGSSADVDVAEAEHGAERCVPVSRWRRVAPGPCGPT